MAVAPPGDTTPTGTVNFTDGTTVICADVALNATYTATCIHTWSAPRVQPHGDRYLQR